LGEKPYARNNYLVLVY